MKKENVGSVKVIPLGGLEQIGMNITAIEYDDSIVVVDCGLSFPEEEMLGIDLIIPDVTYLKENIDKVKAFVKDIKGEKIALSLKFDSENPWLSAEEKYPVGSIVKGTVARMTDFGAFVELEVGVDALLHVSQISKEHIDKPSDVLSVGQEIEAKVVDINVPDRKISLSIKALLADDEETSETEESTEE